MPIHAVVQILTASIAPVIVISGVGLLLLSITNRYGRVIDRARLLMRDLQNSDPQGADVRHLEDQLRHTHQRARLLRAAMVFSSCSIFFVSLTILSLFVEQVFHLGAGFRWPAFLCAVPDCPGDLDLLLDPRHRPFADRLGVGAVERPDEGRALLASEVGGGVIH